LYFVEANIYRYVALFSTVPLIAKLRKETAFSLNQCKIALEACKNDYHQALRWLYAHEQQQGITKAEQLKNRQTQQGLVSVYVTDNALLLTEINCETDFVARNDVFHHFIGNVHQQAMQYNLFSSTELAAHPSIQRLLYEAIARLGENIQFNRVHLFKKRHSEDILGYFVHGSQSPYNSSGCIAAMIRAPSSLEPSLVRNLAQHIVGMNPSSKEAWLEQPFLFDPSKTVGEILAVSHPSIDFLRCECGGNYITSF
jgi:elongation factor Ts